VHYDISPLLRVKLKILTTIYANILPLAIAWDKIIGIKGQPVVK
jgi:hypothetical protein